MRASEEVSLVAKFCQGISVPTFGLWLFNLPWDQVIPHIGIVAGYEEGAEGAEDIDGVFATSEDQMRPSGEEE